MICHDEVNTEYGSYYCSKCNVIFHVHCVTEDERSYSIVSPEDEDEMPYESSITVLESNDAGEATKIEHFLHIHNLMLSPVVGKNENGCDGCLLPISGPFYSCSFCDFFLHKACAELPKMKNVWHHLCQKPLALISDRVFRDYNGKCNACGYTTRAAFRCKVCNFVLHLGCFSLPITVLHKCDEHILSLTDYDDNNYLEHHYCDICEESRDPNCWFYHCAKCDTSAHVDCVLGKYPFVKFQIIRNVRYHPHPHPLTIVKKMYYYPNCDKCHKPCEDLALECLKSECKCIVHWNCVAPSSLQRWWDWPM
ncbi:hypothetical protein Goari_023140 [Gossypium aridum]|uniref:DC1 domain-containing protein n=1 Tax=Gossypium aridum TaxID=34290 RepID=A0A7J8X227_GOSAI|nr:hypothetical protein [Gossypium aridum]